MKADYYENNFERLVEECLKKRAKEYEIQNNVRK